MDQLPNDEKPELDGQMPASGEKVAIILCVLVNNHKSCHGSVCISLLMAMHAAK